MYMLSITDTSYQNVFNLQCPKPERVVTFNCHFLKIITGVDVNVMSCHVWCSCMCQCFIVYVSLNLYDNEFLKVVHSSYNMHLRIQIFYFLFRINSHFGM